jgi:protoporphyrinogen oxidase
MIYDIIIVGSGISGLNCAYQLLKNNSFLKILILEKNDYLGGRIKTHRTKMNNHNYQFEEGAGRFNQNHKLLLNLINELKLKKYIIEIGSKISFYPSTSYEKKFIHESPFKYIDIIIKKSKKIKKEELQKYTFKELAESILNKNEIKFILDSFGYYEQLIKMNAYNAIKLFADGMNPDLKFYSLSCGLDQIIEILVNKIKNNCKIIMNSNVLKINYMKNNLFNVFTQNNIYQSKICITAIPQPNLLKLNIYNNYHYLLKSIGTKSLCRIYSIFNKKDIWFEDIGKSTTNSNTRYVIPNDKTNGLVMISYSDSKFADYWIKLKNENENLFIEQLKKNIYKAFKKKIENPIYTKTCYWSLGTGFWLKNKNSTILYDKILQLNKDIPIFICGENYSESQGWMEGALETSFDVIEKIKYLYK